jgi:hypothetical protein
MTTDIQHPRESEVDFGVQLFHKEDEDVFSFLGIQAEKLEIAQHRQESGRPLPQWSNDDAIAKVLGDQRASREELARYARKGFDFAGKLLVGLEQQLKGILCTGSAVRKEIEALSDNAREIIKYVASSIVGLLAASVPMAIAAAITGIATTIAVILIKNNLKRFCELGVQAVQNQNA